MVRATGHRRTRDTRTHESVRVSLLIPTHALPPLSYKVPDDLRSEIRRGSVVVAPLSGRSRLGVVVGPDADPDRAREDVVSVVTGISLPPALVAACEEVSDSFAVPLPAALRAALPPALDTGRYRVVRPAAWWPWEPGSHASRAAIKRALGADGLREAEAEGRVVLSPALPGRETVEYAVVRPASEPDLRRARRQREVLGFLRDRGGALPVPDLLSATDAGRHILRELVGRGAVRIVRRAAPAPLHAAAGDPADGRGPFRRDATRAVKRRGAFVWRMPSREQVHAVVAVARAVVGAGEQVLVLAPEIGAVDRLVGHLRRTLPAGSTVAAYHSELGRDRAAVHEAARGGGVDVVVGTRAAALMPLARPGALCVVDEPSGAHRAPGYEGLPVHARDVALARAGAEGVAAIFTSPVPSLRLHAAGAGGVPGVEELPPRLPERWPSVRIVDMRGSGAPLSSLLLDSCRRVVGGGGRVGVVVDRLGYATAVSCNRCGAVGRCPDCDLPLAPRGRAGSMVCPRCGRREPGIRRCEACGSDRLSPTGLAVERVRELLSDALDEPVGLFTADRRETADAPVVVGTARCVLGREWDGVLLPDVDGALQGSGIGAAERSFRLVHESAEAARDLLVLQTRLPEHEVLRAAARGDYGALVAAETPRLRASGYPPFGHLAALTFAGAGTAVRRAVESRLRPALEDGAEMSDAVPVARSAERAGGPPSWRVLIRSPERRSVARNAARAARLAASHGLRARVEVDPEEV